MLMALPWFSPDQRLRKDYFEYTSPDGSVKLEVHPSPKCGAAKVWDGDILMYALSKAVAAYLETKQFPRSVAFSAYEYLKQAGKDPGSGKNLADIKDKIDRLTLTRYKCSLINPETTKEQSGQNFGLCSVAWINDSRGRIEKIKITFSDELFQYFATKNDLLSLKKDLLLDAWKEDRSGLRKRLLMLVGTHLGNQDIWNVGLKTLQAMCGHDRELKYFKRDFQKLIPSLPWIVDIEKNKKNEDIVSFVPRD
jgi:plasmid replication initiation protein